MLGGGFSLMAVNFLSSGSPPIAGAQPAPDSCGQPGARRNDDGAADRREGFDRDGDQVLAEALQETKKGALGRVVLSSQRQLVLVRAAGRLLVQRFPRRRGYGLEPGSAARPRTATSETTSTPVRNPAPGSAKVHAG
jgi:hypothetical protein